MRRRKRNIQITKTGIFFLCFGDDILYLWPWKRTRRDARFISIGFQDVFPSLRAIKDLWQEHDEWWEIHTTNEQDKNL